MSEMSLEEALDKAKKAAADYADVPSVSRTLVAHIERLERELASSRAQYQEACDDAARFAEEVEKLRIAHQTPDSPIQMRQFTQEEADAYAGFIEEHFAEQPHEPDSEHAANARVWHRLVEAIATILEVDPTGSADELGNAITNEIRRLQQPQPPPDEPST